MATRHLLVVTTAPVEGERLREHVRQHVGSGDARVRVVAPASKVSPLKWILSDEDEARAEARETAVEASEAIEEVAPADPEVGDTDPVLAIEDALATFPADEILIVTSPGAEATWLEKDAAAEALERFRLPVSHIVVDAG
jgi:hypothetical protein